MDKNKNVVTEEDEGLVQKKVKPLEERLLIKTSQELLEQQKQNNVKLEQEKAQLIYSYGMVILQKEYHEAMLENLEDSIENIKNKINKNTEELLKEK